MRVPGRVTIAIPTLNRSDLAVRVVRSALAQTYPEIEVVVSDDASADDTIAKLSKIQDPRLRVFAQSPRLGIVENFNFCLTEASGEFFLIIGDDDVLLPTAIGRLVAPFLEAGGPSVGMTWCPVMVVDRQSANFWATENGPKIEPVWTLLVEMFAGNRGPRCSSILLRTEDAISVGGYEAKYGDLSDIGNWARAAMHSETSVCIQEPLVQYTMHHGSTTSRSSVEKWQHWARIVHADLVASARARGDVTAERELRAAKQNFISGITLTILIQTIGKPGWIQNALRQALRTPGAMFTPYMLRRLLKDGRKVMTLRRSATKQQSV